MTGSLAGRALARTGRFLDQALDRAVVPGYTTVGYRLRRLWWPAGDPAPEALRGRVALVTGANSGLGKATAEGLARLGARVLMVGRDRERGQAAVDELAGRLGSPAPELVVCDVSDPGDVRRVAAELPERTDRLDVLVHNAGVMPPTRTTAVDGHELSMATHVLGPLLMTELLRPLLRDREARVVLVSSGGMYAQRLPADDPDFARGRYSPTSAYARSKRMQVALTPLLQQRWAPDGIAVYAVHPGWADTPGMATSLPVFRRVTGPLLRDAEQGADTAVWLAATGPRPPGGGLWHDRAARPTHYRRGTRESPAELAGAWEWTRSAAGLEG